MGANRKVRRAAESTGRKNKGFAEFFEKLEGLVARVESMERHVMAMAKAMDALNHNHEQLIMNADSHDAQFAVMARVMLGKFAELGKLIPLVEFNQVFKDFHEFRKHPDFVQHLEEWYSGKELKDMKLAPIPVEKPDDGTPENSEDTVVFGGDYVKDQGGDSVPSSNEPAEPVETFQVSEVQNHDSAVAGAEVEQDHPAVP